MRRRKAYARGESSVQQVGRGRLLLFGGTVGGSGPGVASLSPFMREGYRPVRETAGAVLYENERARPRAFAVHRIVVASTATRPATSLGLSGSAPGGRPASASAEGRITPRMRCEG